MAQGKKAYATCESMPSSFFSPLSLTRQSPEVPVYCLAFPEGVKDFQILGERCCFKSSHSLQMKQAWAVALNVHNEVCSEMKETKDPRQSLLL